MPTWALPPARGRAIIFRKGEKVRVVPEAEMLTALMEEIENTPSPGLTAPGCSSPFDGRGAFLAPTATSPRPPGEGPGVRAVLSPLP